MGFPSTYFLLTFRLSLRSLQVPLLSYFSDFFSDYSPSPVWCNWEGKTHSWAGPLSKEFFFLSFGETLLFSRFTKLHFIFVWSSCLQSRPLIGVGKIFSPLTYLRQGIEWLSRECELFTFRKSTRRNDFVKSSPPTSPSATLANPFSSAYSTPCSNFFHI